MAKAYDAIIIGTGQAGPPLAKRLSQAGMRVAIIERHLFGGTCVNTGCIPTKAMVASAYAAHVTRRAADYGIKLGADPTIDMPKVKARKDAISERSRVGIEKMLRALERCDVFRGHGRFVSPREVQVNADVLEANRIFINVGGRAMVPAIPGLDQVRFLTNSSMMDLDVAPEHLVIVGGSYVGLEFGQMFRRFGSNVTVVEMAPRLVQHEDEDISTAIREILANEGIDVRTSARCISVTRTGGGLTVRTDCASDAEVTGSHLLLAAGRQPNTADLGLEAAGVTVDHSGFIVVDDELQTSVPGIWALGDCNGKGAFTHTSYNDFEIVASNLIDRVPRRVSDRIVTYALYVDPPLGRAGLTEAEATRRKHRVLVGKRPMSRVSRAVEKGEIQGLMKIVVDADTQEILGGAILGSGGDEIIHCVLDAMYAKAPYPVLQRAVHIHPTVSEYIPTLLHELSPPS